MISAEWVSGAQPLVCDPYPRNHATGSFIVIDEANNNTVAAGMICPRESLSGDPYSNLE